MALKHIVGLDHVVVLVRDLDRRRRTWRRLGFTLAPRGTHSAIWAPATTHDARPGLPRAHRRAHRDAAQRAEPRAARAPRRGHRARGADDDRCGGRRRGDPCARVGRERSDRFRAAGDAAERDRRPRRSSGSSSGPSRKRPRACGSSPASISRAKPCGSPSCSAMPTARSGSRGWRSSHRRTRGGMPTHGAVVDQESGDEARRGFRVPTGGDRGSFVFLTAMPGARFPAIQVSSASCRKGRRASCSSPRISTPRPAPLGPAASASRRRLCRRPPPRTACFGVRERRRLLLRVAVVGRRRRSKSEPRSKRPFPPPLRRPPRSGSGLRFALLPARLASMPLRLAS